MTEADAPLPPGKEPRVDVPGPDQVPDVREDPDLPPTVIEEPDPTLPVVPYGDEDDAGSDDEPPSHGDEGSP